MKKILMIVTLVSIALTGYSKTNGTETNAQAPRATITLYVTGEAGHSITVHATEPVPETVDCQGQYQAPGNTTGYWSATLMPGATEVTIASDITENDLVDLGYVVAGGKHCNVEINMGGSFETALAIYNCLFYANH